MYILYKYPTEGDWWNDTHSVSSTGRCWHDTDMDHDDAIVDLACCPKLCLFATCSVDGTIRVWSDEGKLLR